MPDEPNQPAWRPPLYGGKPLSPHLKGKPYKMEPIMDPLTPQEIFHNFTCSIHCRVARLNEALAAYRRKPKLAERKKDYLAAREAVNLVLDRAESDYGIKDACIHVKDKNGYILGLSVQGVPPSPKSRELESDPPLSSSSDVGIPSSTWSSSSSSSTWSSSSSSSWSPSSSSSINAVPAS